MFCDLIPPPPYLNKNGGTAEVGLGTRLGSKGNYKLILSYTASLSGLLARPKQAITQNLRLTTHSVVESYNIAIIIVPTTAAAR